MKALVSRRGGVTGDPLSRARREPNALAVAPMLQRARLNPTSLTTDDVRQLQRMIGNRGVSAVLANPTRRPGLSQVQAAVSATRARHGQMLQRISAHRVEYQHNRKVTTDDKGRVLSLHAPIDISFGSEDHSEYFALERNESQLTGLRTIHWEMDDDWFAAAYHHAYKGKAPRGRAANYWLPKIKKSGGAPMAASDGHSLTTATKKRAPHFDGKWNDILNEAIVKGSGQVVDTETERREVKKERSEQEEKTRTAKAAERLAGASGSLLGTATDENGEIYEYMTQADALAAGLTWVPN